MEAKAQHAAPRLTVAARTANSRGYSRRVAVAAAQHPPIFFVLFDAVALSGWRLLLEDLQEVAVVRGDETLAHGFRLLSAVVGGPDDDPDDPPPASPAMLPPSRAAPS
jgi:hypothetical protein